MNKVFNGLADFKNKTAIITDDGALISYTELCERSDSAAERLSAPNGYIWFEVNNTVEAVIAFIGACRKGWPVLLNEPGAFIKYPALREKYPPAYVYSEEQGAVDFRRHASSEAAIHDDLAILLSTSGSTGDAKLVRLSNENLVSNAKSIATYLEITHEDRAMMTLPVYYSFGLSVLTSHLLSGATFIFNSYSVMTEEFWQKFDRYQATSFCGVPRSFELLRHTSFFETNHSSLRYFTQAGGKLPAGQVAEFAQYAHDHGKKFYVMYGQTEASPRIAYMPFEDLLDNADCIGKAIPGGRLYLADEHQQELTQVGEQGVLWYEGPNVMMGYAHTLSDLAKGKEVERLETGDVGVLNENGYFKIVGRLKRFIKVSGIRLSLDTIEAQLSGQGVSAVVAGDDALLAVAISLNTSEAEVSGFIKQNYDLPPGVLSVVRYKELPLLPNGKYDYRKILENAKNLHNNAPEAVSLRQALAKVLECETIEDEVSFINAGGDSLSFVEGSKVVSNYFNRQVNGWENLSIKSLERMLESGDVVESKTDVLIVARSFAIALTLFSHFFLAFQVWGEELTIFKLLTRTATPALLIISGILLSKRELSQSFSARELKRHLLRYLPHAMTLYCLFCVVQLAAYIGGNQSLGVTIQSLLLLDAGRFANILIIFAGLYMLTPFVLLLWSSFKEFAALIILGVSWGVWATGRVFDIELGYFGSFVFGFGSHSGPSLLQSLTFLVFGYLLGKRDVGGNYKLLALLLFAGSLTALAGVVVFNSAEYLIQNITSYSFRGSNHPLYYAFGIVTVFVVLGLSQLLLRLKSVSTGNNMFLVLGTSSMFAYTLANIVLNLIPAFQLSVIAAFITVALLIALLAITTAEFNSTNPKLLKIPVRFYNSFTGHWKVALDRLVGLLILAPKP